MGLRSCALAVYLVHLVPFSFRNNCKSTGIQGWNSLVVFNPNQIEKIEILLDVDTRRSKKLYMGAPRLRC